MVKARFNSTFESWKVSARAFLTLKVHPSTVEWGDDLQLFSNEQSLDIELKEFKISKELTDLLKTLSWGSDSSKWSLMYRLLYLYIYEDSNILAHAAHKDVLEANLLRKSIGRDIHKMHAFVRFKKLLKNGEELYVAWHKPEHNIIKPGSEFFKRRFGDKKWSIYSTKESAHWDMHKLYFGPGMKQESFKATDLCDELWGEYYSSIYNPARLNIKCMKNEMPTKYWSTMPETELIEKLVKETPKRLEQMRLATQVVADVDPLWNLSLLEKNIKNCNACNFKCSEGNNTFVNIGDSNSDIMVVTDRPIQENILASFEKTGNNYYTSVIKSTKNMLIKGSDLSACQPWLLAEIKQIKPKAILSIGQKSAIALIGKQINIKDEVGHVYFQESLNCYVIIGDYLGKQSNIDSLEFIHHSLSEISNLSKIPKISA